MAQRAGVTAVETPAPAEAEAGLSKAERAYRWIKDRIHGAPAPSRSSRRVSAWC